MAQMKQEYTLKAIYEGQGELGKFRSDLKSLSKVESIRALGNDVRSLTTSFNAAKAKLEEQARAMGTADKVTAEMTRQYKAAQREVTGLAAALDKKKAAFKGATAAARESGINTASLATEEKRLATSAEATGKVWAARQALGVRSHKDIREEVTRLQQAYTDLKKSGMASAVELFQAKQRLKQKTAELTSATNVWVASYERARNGAVAMAGVGYGLIKAFQEFSSFESGMAEVYTLVDISTEKFKEFKSETKDIVGSLPQDSKDLTKALYDIVSAGVQLSDSNKVLELSGKAATAGITDTKTAVNIGVGAMNAYGKSVEDLGWIYDILFQTVKSGVTTFPELAQYMGDVLPTARAADVGLQDVAASIATLTKAGIKTPQAATALRGAILAMAAPTPEAKKKFEELGITWEGLLPTLEAIANKGLSIDQMRLLIPDQEAAKGVLSLTQNMDVLRATLDSMDSAGGSMESAYQKMADPPEHEIKQMMKSLSDLGKEVGELASKVILPAAAIISGLVGVINNSPAIIQYLISAIGAAVTAGVLWHIGLKDITLALVGVAAKMHGAAWAAGVYTSAIGAARAGMAALTAAAISNPVLSGMAAIILTAGAAWAIFGKNSLDASKKHAKTAATIGESRTAIDSEIASLEKLQKTFETTAPGTDAHLKAERELAQLLPGANLDLDEQGRLIAKVGDAAAENSTKLGNYISQLKEQSQTQLALQVEQQARAYGEADRALQEYKNNLQNWYGIGPDGDDWASALWRNVNKLTGTYDKNIQKGGEVRANLNDQKKAYNDLLQTMNKAGVSADDLAAALDDAHVSAELKSSIIAEYRKFGTVIEGVGASADKAAAQQESAFRTAAASIKDEYLQLAEKIKSTLNDIAQRNRSFASEIRAMNREGLTDAAAWQDLKKEASEYAAAAENALIAGNYEEAIKLADEAKNKYKELNTEVKAGEQVVISEADARKKAIEGMTQANAIAVSALEKRNAADKEAAKNLEGQIGDFKTGWHDAFETFLRDGKESIEELESALDALTSKKRNVNISVSSSESRQSGGVIGLRMAAGGAVAFRNMMGGGHFPGFGGGDRRHVVAEDGEYMFDKYRVRDAGLDVVREFHRGNYAYVVVELMKRLRSGVAMQFGGFLDNVHRATSGPQMMAAGGSVVGAGDSMGDMMTINLNFGGGSSIPVTSTRENARALKREFERMAWRSSKG